MKDIINFDVDVEVSPQYDLNVDSDDSINFEYKDDVIIVRRETYTYNQTTASNIWVIEHELDRHPSVTVVDSAGTQIVGDVQYISNNLIILTFAAAFSGTAYLN